MIRSVLIEGVRCFATRQEVPLRPITVLVGENSSGKSTFLALTRIAWGLVEGQIRPDFNEEPFQLGTYDQIRSWSGDSAERAKSFHLSVELENPRLGEQSAGHLRSARVLGTFLRRGVEARLRSWKIDFLGLSCDLVLALDDREQSRLRITEGTGEYEVPLPEPISIMEELGGARNMLQLGVGSLEYLREEHGTLARMPAGPWFELTRRALWGLEEAAGPRPLAFAPIRTRPQRTYDPLREIQRPEGSHVPVMLARLSASDPVAWKELIEALNRFGMASGLFSSLDVRRVGPEESDPFQIQVNVSGQPFNLVDVGYGVSQILPVIVDILRGPEHQMFLMQQPEVHLHPRAQAELATFLGSLVALQRKSFVVETHSDYLVDRLRMDVRDKRNIKADQVMILYFERQGSQVQIHPIEIDEQGNLVNVPPGYRSFFLEEDRRLLGIA